MKRRTAWLIVGLLVLAFGLGCGGSSGGGGPTGNGPSTPNIAGLWTGTQTITSISHPACTPQPGQVENRQISITQQGSNIELVQIGDQGLSELTGVVRAGGSFTVTGAIGVTSETINGTVQGNTLTATGSVGEVGVCVVGYTYAMTRT